MLNFNGDFNVKSDIGKAYTYISTPDDIAKLVPDLIDYQKMDNNNLKLIAKAGVSFIKGKFNLELNINDSEKYDHLILKGKGSGTGANVDFTVNFYFKDNDGVANIKWNADVNIVGSAASMGGKMIKSAASKYINKLVDKYRETLENGL